MDGEYVAVRADEPTLGTAVEALREGTLHGLNITMPLKTAAAALADRLTSLARDAESVNTLRVRDGLVEAHSTDAVAFGEIFADPALFAEDAPILVLGSGGSARALLAALEGREVHISGRSPDRAEELAARFDSVTARDWGSSVSGAVLVNATPLGMRGERLPTGVLDACSGLVDLPYGEQPTPSATWADSRGLPLVDGIEFLARQAAASFRWWTGRAVDSAVLARAARNV